MAALAQGATHDLLSRRGGRNWPTAAGAVCHDLSAAGESRCSNRSPSVGQPAGTFLALGDAGLPRRTASLALADCAAALAGTTATASTSISAPGRASAVIATAVLAGGAAVSTKRSRTSRNRPIWPISTK
jgi:hypothetical protein